MVSLYLCCGKITLIGRSGAGAGGVDEGEKAWSQEAIAMYGMLRVVYI